MCSNINVAEQLCLPKPSDKSSWKALDDILYEELPIEVGGNPEEQLDNLERHLYKRLKERFGVKPKSTNTGPKKPQRSHQHRKLRRLKKDTKLKYKQALREGDKKKIKDLKKEFHKLVRLHNKIRKLEIKQMDKKSSNKAQQQFRENPHQFAKKLFNDNQNRQPSFQKPTAEKYFKETLNDKKRDYKYHPMKNMKKAAKPKMAFNTKPPTFEELDNYLQKRRNKSSPGTNKIPYLVYKKCPKTTKILHEVICNIWRTAVVPLSWRIGETILISKEENTNDPSLFRPITVKNASGNIAMGILAQRLIRFLCDNNYIDQSIQKGFMEKISGCVEHTEALSEILMDAKKNGKQIVTTWLDLQNAYGSVPHNLIQFALEWYHVPENIRKLVFNYYDNQFIRVKTRDWTTDWMQCLVGVFQGCPLSCILFLAVFNLCLDRLDGIEDVGYQLNSDITAAAKAYADDLTLIAKDPEGCQRLINSVQEFLTWTRTMKAKPAKCKAHAMKKFRPNKQMQREGHRTQYVAFDPKLTINGKEIAYIHSQPVRFLGKLIYKDLKDNEIRSQVTEKLNGLLDATERSQINGPMKLWMYNNAILPRLTWEFTIYNFPISFVEKLEAACTKYLKKWAGISRNTTTSALYRSRPKYGLELKKLTTSVKCMQLTKYHLNKYSRDGTTQTLYRETLERKKNLARWNGVKEIEQKERHLIINEMCRGQTDRAGLGFKANQKLIKDMNPQEHRKALTSLVKDIDEENMLVHLYSCAAQGNWTTWDSVMQVDTSWKKILYLWSPELLAFHVNSIHDTLPSPANLKLWGKTNLGICQLCNHQHCTLFHILNGCKYSLDNGRYNWRHDQTLRAIAEGLLPYIEEANRSPVSATTNAIPTIRFITKEGTAYRNPPLLLANNIPSEILKQANDWEFLLDEEHNQIVFPPQILETAKRPDIIIYSERTKTVILIELTVPIEQNLTNANLRKKCKYSELVAECENRSWTTYYFPVEVGSRGFYNTSLPKCLAALGIPKGKRKNLLDHAAKTALRGSYVIWLSRHSRAFQKMSLIPKPRNNSEGSETVVIT